MRTATRPNYIMLNYLTLAPLRSRCGGQPVGSVRAKVLRPHVMLALVQGTAILRQEHLQLRAQKLGAVVHYYVEREAAIAAQYLPQYAYNAAVAWALIRANFRDHAMHGAGSSGTP